MRNKVAKSLRKVAKQVYGPSWKKHYKEYKRGYKWFNRYGTLLGRR